MTAQTIIERLYANDPFSQWLGIKVMEVSEGNCRLEMMVRDEMCNGLGMAHGGITYSLADSALAFASNSHGKMAVSIETSISHIKSLYPGDMITATAIEKMCGKTLAVYEVKVQKEDGVLVALFKGTVYRKEKEWKLED